MSDKKILAGIAIIILIGLGLSLNANHSSNTSDNFLKVQNQIDSSGNYNFSPQQSPKFDFPSLAYASDLKDNTAVYDSKGQKINTQINVSQSGKGASVEVKQPQQFLPGKYSLIVNQNGKKIEQNFTWGVLAINTNKSVYSPGETADLALAVLDEKGKMVCDASVTLNIKDPSGQTSTLSVANGGIVVNPECTMKKATVNPDYEAKYQVGNKGDYQMSLTATTSKGTYNIVDSFSVNNNIDYDIERITATRIFPFSTYPVAIKINAKKDFSGQIIEIVPAAFTITPLDNTVTYNNIQNNQDNQYVIWNVSLKKGQSKNIGYSFKPPTVSPQFYLLGPLNLTSGNTVVFQEKRAWQLAIDDTTYSSTIIGTPGLVGYWRLGESSGTSAVDSSTGGHNGTYNNTPTLGVSGAIAGDPDTAVGFTAASSEYVSVAGLSVPTTSISLEVWINGTTAWADTGLIGKGAGGGSGVFLYAQNPDQWQFDINATQMAFTSSPTSKDGKWHYFVGTWDGTNGRMYYDGNLLTGPTALPGPILQSATFMIGQYGAPSGTYWTGSFDEGAVYNTVLTPTQITTHYNLGVNTFGELRLQGVRMQGVRIN